MSNITARSPLLKIDQGFTPATWLRSPHLQTIYPALFRKRLSFDLTPQRLELRDADFIDLAWHTPYQTDNTPTVLILHGLEGNLHSHYISPTVATLEQAGFNSVFMHLRGCSSEPNRLERSYHSGASEDLSEVLSILAAQDRLPDAAIGFSLGGNLLLKYLGEQGDNAMVKTAIAISVPYRLDHAAQKMEQGLSKLYGYYLLRKLKRSLTQKFSNRQATIGSSLIDTSVKGINTIYQFDDKFTAPLNGFLNADDYYQRCSSYQFIPSIKTPTLLIHALDDPFMYPSDVPSPDSLAEPVSLLLTQQGGHVGFISAHPQGGLDYWLDGVISDYLTTQIIANQKP